MTELRTEHHRVTIVEDRHVVGKWLGTYDDTRYFVNRVNPVVLENPRGGSLVRLLDRWSLRKVAPISEEGEECSAEEEGIVCVPRMLPKGKPCLLVELVEVLLCGSLRCPLVVVVIIGLHSGGLHLEPKD